MINSSNAIQADRLHLSFIGWKAYNRIKKKAMEQEFSWSGLVLSLSIAFFIVLACAQILNIVYDSVITAQEHEYFLNQKVYHLESLKHLNNEVSNRLFISDSNIMRLNYAA